MEKDYTGYYGILKESNESIRIGVQSIDYVIERLNSVIKNNKTIIGYDSKDAEDGNLESISIIMQKGDEESITKKVIERQPNESYRIDSEFYNMLF